MASSSSSSSSSGENTNTSIIRDWQSIIALIVFVLANLAVLFPFRIPIFVPHGLWDSFLTLLNKARIIDPSNAATKQEARKWKRLHFPINFLTGPLIAVLFLLATTAIGRQEVHDGTVGADHIAPIEVMVFFISLAYIAISIDCTGLIRWLSVKVLQRGGGKGRLLFLYLYIFFLILGTAVGNDPIVLSGTPFLAYMTRASSNIQTPRPWIFTQFAIANVASAILVTSNPTNLVLAGAFQIRFIDYTANIIVPVLVTVVCLFPFLLWVVFRGQKSIPSKIEIRELPEHRKNREPANPNLPQPGPPGHLTDEEKEEHIHLDSLEEVLNPYLHKRSAIFTSCVMAAVLVTVLVVNATAPAGKEYPAYWVTLPAAVLVFAWDAVIGWTARHKNRETVRVRRAEATAYPQMVEKPTPLAGSTSSREMTEKDASAHHKKDDGDSSDDVNGSAVSSALDQPQQAHTKPPGVNTFDEKANGTVNVGTQTDRSHSTTQRTTLQSWTHNKLRWAEETFPTNYRTFSYLPFPLVPFALCMFVLVQALVTKGWVPVFAYGWHHWVHATGTVGAIGGMAFLSVILCNFAGTNIGTTILLCRVIQAWVEIHQERPEFGPISQRTFWATVYSMAIGVNYGAFSIAISGALAGMLWQSILSRKGIVVSRMEFWRVNTPLIIFTMIVGCAALVGEVWLFRSGTEAYAG